MSSPQKPITAPADLSASPFSDVLRAIERVRHPVKQEFLARSKDFERLKGLLSTLEIESRRKDTEIQRLSNSLEQTKRELAVSEDNLRTAAQANAELEVKVSVSKDMYEGALTGQLYLIEAAEAMIFDEREELEEVQMLAESAEADYEQKASEQAAELAATRLELEETTAALRAAEEKNENLISVINEAASLCCL